jgi:hypothetical protein
MSLIVIAATTGNVGPLDALACRDSNENFLKAADAAEQLRGQPDVSAKFRDEMLVANAKLFGHDADGDLVWLSKEPLHRAIHSGRPGGREVRVQQSFPEKLFENSEFVLRRSRGEKLIAQTPRAASPQGVQFDNSIAHFIGRQAEKRGDSTGFEVRADHRSVGQCIDDDVLGVRPGKPAASKRVKAGCVPTIEQLSRFVPQVDY